MAKHKKRKPPEKPPPAPGPLNAPFARLKQMLPLAKAEEKPLTVSLPLPVTPFNDEELFAQAMQGVRKLQTTPKSGRRRQLPAKPLQPKALNEDLAVLADLADLVSGSGDFDFFHSDEYVSGAWPGINPELKDRLAKGEFPIQDYVDLHGLNEGQAQARVETFLSRSLANGLRHVLIVTGRGMGSPQGEPVLKNCLLAWLNSKRFKKHVLAFCTARPQDGGEGAFYILLRRWSGKVAPRPQLREE